MVSLFPPRVELGSDTLKEIDVQTIAQVLDLRGQRRLWAGSRRLFGNYGVKLCFLFPSVVRPRLLAMLASKPQRSAASLFLLQSNGKGQACPHSASHVLLSARFSLLLSLDCQKDGPHHGLSHEQSERQ